MLVDSHAHISTEKYDPDRAQVLERAREAGVVGIIDVGCDEDSHQFAVAPRAAMDQLAQPVVFLASIYSLLVPGPAPFCF